MLKGMKCSPETIEKIRAAAIRRGPLSPESRKRQAASMRRHLKNKENHPMWGRHHTEESRAKISTALRGKYTGANSPWFGKKLSPEHREKLRLAHLGLKQSEETKRKRKQSYSREKTYNWKGGISHHADGYIFQEAKKHPACDSRGYVLQHRLVAESLLKRYLEKTEQVHHVNGIRNDNRPENLMVFINRRAHVRFEANLAVKASEIIFDGRSFHAM